VQTVWRERGQQKPGQRGAGGGVGSRPVSRVLSRTVIHLGRMSPCASSDLPGGTRGPRTAAKDCPPPYLVLLRVGFTLPPMLPPARCALTAPFHPYLAFSGSRRKRNGGIFSVALSVGSRPPGVTWHPALWSPDFPPSPRAGRATVRPTPRVHCNRFRGSALGFMPGCLAQRGGGSGFSRDEAAAAGALASRLKPLPPGRAGGP